MTSSPCCIHLIRLLPQAAARREQERLEWAGEVLVTRR
jgi:hypothetical protein